MALNMFWQVKQKVFKCYIVPLPLVKSLLTIGMNEIFPCLVCYGQKLKSFVQKWRKRFMEV